MAGVTRTRNHMTRLLETARERPALPDVPCPDAAAQIRERDRRRSLSEELLFRAYGVDVRAAA